MEELEEIVKESTVHMKSFDEFVSYCTQNNPLIAIQVSERKFISFIVSSLGESSNGTFRPVTAGKVYSCDLPDGFNSSDGECSYPLKSYPANIAQETFEKKDIFVLNPESNVGAYILKFMEAGRKKAQVLLRERQ